MKLLLDENLSHRLPARINLIFPESAHIKFISELGEESSDLDIWNYSKSNGFTVITKDKDLVILLKEKGHPPNIIKLNIGNSSLSKQLMIIQTNEHKIKSYFSKKNNGLLVL